MRTNRPASPGPKIAPGTSNPATTPKHSPRDDDSPGGHPSLAFETLTGGTYDSNIERDQGNVDSYGFVAGGALRFRSRNERPGLIASYEVARHEYTEGAQWSRFSHNLNAVWSRRLTDKLGFETLGEVSIKGSSEDRDVSDQYIIGPRMNYRLNSSQRMRVYGVYRMRKYPGTELDANNRYVGFEFRDEAEEGGEWEVGYRYETNSGRLARRSYTRRTWHTEYLLPLWGDAELISELQFRSQRYNQRAIEVEEENVPRHDYRISPSLQFVQPLLGRLRLILNYDFEQRTSNDPEEGYRVHVLTLSTRYRF